MSISVSDILRLEGKTAIVTGGAKGIGQAIAFRLAEAGAKVIIADIDFESAKLTVEEIRTNGGEADAVRTDITRVEDAQKMVDTAVKVYGGLDILVNNAGWHTIPSESAFETTEADWDKTIAINLKGMFFCSQAAAKVMKEAGRGGKILNISSTAAMRPPLRYNAYAAAKGGVESLTRSLALEFSSYKILVNAIEPGGILTPLAKQSVVNNPSANKWQPRKKLIGGDWGEPDDIAKVALFLVSPGADYMTGSILVVDAGGLVM